MRPSYQCARIAWIVLAWVMMNFPVWSQITITSNEISFPIGSTFYTYEVSDTAGTGIPVNVGTAGGPQTWTFNETIYPGGHVISIDIVNPTSTPFGNQFPTATASFQHQEDSVEVYLYLELTTAELDFLGAGFVVGQLSLAIENTPPARLLVFPVTFGSTWTNNYSNRYTVGPGMEQFDSTSAQLTVDAWGTYVGPTGTYDCLRMRQDVNEISQLLVNGVPISSDTSTYIEYIWVAEQAGLLADVMSRDGETDPNFTLAADVSFPVPPTGIGEEEPPLVSQFELRQNYPNPFNPSTTIRFSLPEAMDVHLEVFNLMGQKVATLVNGHLTAGEHQVEFDGRGLPSGIYLYRLTGNGLTQTRRMVLMK